MTSMLRIFHGYDGDQLDQDIVNRLADEYCIDDRLIRKRQREAMFFVFIYAYGLLLSLVVLIWCEVTPFAVVLLLFSIGWSLGFLIWMCRRAVILKEIMFALPRARRLRAIKDKIASEGFTIKAL